MGSSLKVSIFNICSNVFKRSDLGILRDGVGHTQSHRATKRRKFK